MRVTKFSMRRQVKESMLIATDWRLRTDKDLDFTEPNEAPHVLEMWRFGREVLGKMWPRASRLALFDHGDTPDKTEAAVQRQAFVRYIEELKPKHVIILPTPEAQLGEAEVALKGTHVWNALRAPDSLDAMRGTWWNFNAHTRVTAVYPIAKRVKEMHRWQTARWMRRAYEGKLLRSPRPEIVPNQAMVDTLRRMVGHPCAVDLEFIPDSNIVTAIGVSNGVFAVSIPWDRFRIAGTKRWSSGIMCDKSDTGLGREIIGVLAELLADPAPKYAHNFVADIPRLEKLGFVVNGNVGDTYAAHAIAFPEARHALQLAAANLLCAPPWKSLYKPRTEKYLTKDDGEFWTCDPTALRIYNAQDAFYTWHLAQVVLPYVELNPCTVEKQ